MNTNITISSNTVPHRNTDNGKIRLFWVDGLKCLLAFLVFFTHMSVLLSIDLGKYEQIFYGISGKYAVAVFAVILGFFANNSTSSNSDLSVKILRRYFHFVFPLLMVTSATSIIYVLSRIEEINVWGALKHILKESFLLGENSYCPQAWCLTDFFIASLIIYVFSGKRYRNAIWVLIFLLLTLGGKIWIAVCLLGALLKEIHVFTDKELPFRKTGFLFSLLKISLIAFSFTIIRYPENSITYLFDGISATLMLWVCLNSSVLKRLLSANILSACGKISFEFFMVHIEAYYITIFVLDALFTNTIPYDIQILITVIVTLCISVVLAYSLSLLTKRFNKLMIACKNQLQQVGNHEH